MKSYLLKLEIFLKRYFDYFYCLMSVINKTLREIIQGNHRIGNTLYRMGISFFEYPDKTLSEICLERGLDPSCIHGERIQFEEYDFSFLQKLPLPLLIEYLKHGHHSYIKYKLPYVDKLVNFISESDCVNSSWAKDLSYVYARFYQEFIEHIYEEEDTLFNYALKLFKASEGQFSVYDLYQSMEKYSVKWFSEHHLGADDEMTQLRLITGGYRTEGIDNLCVQVIFHELQSFEEDLRLHARAENDILIPKLSLLESEVKEKLQTLIRLN